MKCGWHTSMSHEALRLLILATGPCFYCKATLFEPCHVRGGDAPAKAPHQIRRSHAQAVICTYKK